MIKIVYSSNIAISCCHSMTAAYYVFTIIFIIIVIVSILEEGGEAEEVGMCYYTTGNRSGNLHRSYSS